MYITHEVCPFTWSLDHVVLINLLSIFCCCNFIYTLDILYAIYLKPDGIVHPPKTMGYEVRDSKSYRILRNQRQYLPGMIKKVFMKILM